MIMLVQHLETGLLLHVERKDNYYVTGAGQPCEVILGHHSPNVVIRTAFCNVYCRMLYDDNVSESLQSLQQTA